MFSGIQFFFIPSLIGEKQLALLKKRVVQYGGIIQDKFDLKLNPKIISNLRAEEISSFLSVDPNQHCNALKPEWISKSIAMGSLSPEDQYTITQNSAKLNEISGSIKRQSSETMEDTATLSTSPSKLQYIKHHFGDPGFGQKTKSNLKKRNHYTDDPSPPNAAKPEKRNSEKLVDIETLEPATKKHKVSENVEVGCEDLISIDPRMPITEQKLELLYDKSDDEDYEDVDIVLEGKPKSKKSHFSILPRILKPSTSTSLNAKVGEKIAFDGKELPIQMAVQEGVFEDPKFYAILKPAPQKTLQSILDEERYKGPWADEMSRSILEVLSDDDDDLMDVHSGWKNGRQILDDSFEDTIDEDSQDYDFSESQVAVDSKDYEKNFGDALSKVQSSKYLSYQKAKLACQQSKPKGGIDDASTAQFESSDSKQFIVDPHFNHNKQVTDYLEKLEAICKGSGDNWRAYAYRKAANILKSLKYEITSKQEALSLRGIGESIAEKIGEIIDTGKLRKLDALQNETRIQALALFMGIYGVGMATANKWCALGYKTLEDIEKNAQLTYAQAVGLKYYHELKERIPRSEMERITNQIKIIVSQKIDPQFIVEICGSYRRGKADCGDIDIIITHKKPQALKTMLFQLVPILHKEDILTHDFIMIDENSDRYMGVCHEPPKGKHRRIDILAVPPHEWPFALIYFTGSGHFNRSMRFWAGKRGYSLSQHGLRVNYGNENKGPYIAGITTEKQIFEALGLDYRPPEDRDV